LAETIDHRVIAGRQVPTERVARMINSRHFENVTRLTKTIIKRHAATFACTSSRDGVDAETVSDGRDE